MDEALDAVTSKLPGIGLEPAVASRSIPEHIKNRPTLTINTVHREVKSPTPETPPPTTRRAPVYSIESPLMDPTSPESSWASSSTPPSRVRVVRSHGGPQETRESMVSADDPYALKSPTPSLTKVLKSPTPSPSKALGSTSNDGPSQGLGNEDMDTPSSRSSTSTATLPAKKKEFIRAPPGKLSRTWPVDVRAGLNEVVRGTAEAFERASPQYVRPVVQPSPMPKLPGPLFCCADLKKHLRTNPIMPTDLLKIHGPVIDSFVASINPAFETPISVPSKDFDHITRIVKVNRVLCGIEISTHLFIIGANETFTKLADLPGVLLFNPQGRGSYQSYSCGKHRMMYRVGVYDKRYAPLTQKSTFGDKGLDLAMGLVSEAEMAVDHYNALMRTY